MNRTALYRALVEAGTSEKLAKEAAESVVYGQEAATHADVLGVRNELVDVKGEVTELKGKVTEVEAKVAEVRGEVAAVKGKVTEVEAKVVAVEAKVVEVRSEVAESRAEFRAGLAVIESKVEARLASTEAAMERGLRQMTFRFVGLMAAVQGLFLAVLKLADMV